MKELIIVATVENLDTVSDFINTELKKSGCTLKMQNRIGIAVEEIFVNISNYSYKPEIGNVSVRIAVGDDVTIEFEDNGVPYNPLDKEDPDITVSAAMREVGGLGIFMVKQIMDSMEYRREGGRNILTMRKTKWRERAC